MSLTPKREQFCLEVVATGNQTEAYRRVYSTKNMAESSINVEASKLCAIPKISQRIKLLQEEQKNRSIYTLEKSVKKDLRLIERYESASDVLSDINSTPKEVEVAERTIRHIGASGYSQAQDRLSKQHGFYEQDNKQKTNEVIQFQLPDNKR